MCMCFCPISDASRNWRTDPVKDEGGEQQNKRTWNRAGGDREDGGTFWRQSSSSSNSGLPEWCDNDIDQDVGTFDASGQFKSLKVATFVFSRYLLLLSSLADLSYCLLLLPFLAIFFCCPLLMSFLAILSYCLL